MHNESEARKILTFDLAIYRLNAIKKAAYKFGDRCFIEIRLADDQKAEVHLLGRNGQADIDLRAGEFTNEVLDQELRETIGEETTAVRNLLLAQAFSEIPLIDEVGDRAEFSTDPLGIGRSESFPLEPGVN